VALTQRRPYHPKQTIAGTGGAVAESALLAEFRAAFPYVTRLPELEAHLLARGWGVRSDQRPAALQAYVDLLPLTLGNGTTLEKIGTLAKPAGDGALWVLLQAFSVGTLRQAMVAFYDFGASAPIDPEDVSAVVGAAPESVRRVDEGGEEARWAQGAAEAPPALTVNLAFAPADARMPGARIVASVVMQGAATG
jgi:hypothetical protein